MLPATIGRIRARATWGDAAVLAVVLLVIGGPALFTHDGFAPDFTNHMWLVWVQEQAFSRHLTPTYFVNAYTVGVFYPYFVFYGGTLYAAAGAVAAAAGNVAVAYIAVTLLAVAAAYGGLVWLARQLGLRGWMAHTPAVTFVASAYYVSNLYGRGAWTEFMATSTIPLLLASGCKIVRSPRIEPVPFMLFVVAAVFFAGSHNVTLVLASLTLIVGLLLLWLAVGRELAPYGWRRMLQLAGLLVVAISVDGWFLFPAALHTSDTAIGAGGAVFRWASTSFFNTPGILFDPLRAVPGQSPARALFVQAPDWFLLWVLAAGGALWSRAQPRLRRAAAALAVLLMAILALIMVGPLWDAMPQTVREVQYPYRLNTYVALCTAGLVLAGALAVQRTANGHIAHVLRGALAAATAVSIGLCVWQLWVPDTHEPASYRDRQGVFTSTHVIPRTWYALTDYDDASQPVVPVSGEMLVIDPRRVNSDHVTLTVNPPRGPPPFWTNIAGGPYVVKLAGGLVRAGRTPGLAFWAWGLTAARRAGAGNGPVSLSLTPAGGSLAVGRVISLLAILLLFTMLALSSGRNSRSEHTYGRRSRLRAQAGSPSER